MDNPPGLQSVCLCKAALEGLHHKLPIHFSDTNRHELFRDVRQRVNITSPFPRHGIGLYVCPVSQEGSSCVGDSPVGATTVAKSASPRVKLLPPNPLVAMPNSFMPPILST